MFSVTCRACVVAHTSRICLMVGSRRIALQFSFAHFQGHNLFPGSSGLEEVSCSKDFLYSRLGLQLVRQLRDDWTKIVVKTSMDEPLN